MIFSFPQWTFLIKQQKEDPSHSHSYGLHLKSHLLAADSAVPVLAGNQENIETFSVFSAHYCIHLFLLKTKLKIIAQRLDLW